MTRQDAAREAARHGNGQFGIQPRDEADVILDAPGESPFRLPVAAQAVIDRFGRRSMSCTNESKRLVAGLRRAGVPATSLSLTEEGRGPHAVAVIGDAPAPGEPDQRMVVDFTFDQFDPDAPVPLVAPLEDYVADWDDYGTDYYAGSILSSWRTVDSV